MVPPNILGPDLNGKDVNETQYRGMIGSLMYLTTSRADIQFSTCLCARYQANPKESHLIAVKRIFRYLKDVIRTGKAPQLSMDVVPTYYGSKVKSLSMTSYMKRDHVLKGDIELHFIPTQYQLADIFTKPLKDSTFKRLIVELGMRNINSKPEALASRKEN
nr:retrotransposon protein, putative, unclassified [Tanacetum cinerariifolium]